MVVSKIGEDLSDLLTFMQFAGLAVLDCSKGYIPAPQFQSDIVLQVSRFFDGELFFTAPQLRALLVGVQGSPPHLRQVLAMPICRGTCVHILMSIFTDNIPRPHSPPQVFFENVSACRRRALNKWKETPVAKAFLAPTEFHLVRDAMLCFCQTSCI